MNLAIILVTFIAFIYVTCSNVIMEFGSQALLISTVDKLLSTESNAANALLKINPKIVNGTEVAPNGLSYQVQIKKGGEHQCGGTVLNEYFILTAAHCVEYCSSECYEVTAGEHNLVENEGHEQARNVKTIIMHENYNPDAVEAGHDIALLRLEYPLELTPQVQPPYLPELGFNITEQQGIVSGWGLNATNGIVSEILQMVTLDIMSNAKCNRIYNGQVHIPDTSFCAYSLGKDSCQYDSGGPMTIRSENGSYILVGIVSYGYDGCAGQESPGIYTRVSQYLEWIQSHAV